MRKRTAETTSQRRAESAARTAGLPAADRRSESGHIAVLDRATALLAALALSPTPATLNEAAKQAGLSKATAFRILATMTEHGLVEQDEATSSYRLGIAPLRLGMAVLDGIPMHRVARPVMRAVCDMLNETVVLSVRNGDLRVNIDAVECTNAIGSSRRIGEPRPLHVGPASRVMLAAMSDAQIQAYLKRHQLTKNGSSHTAYRAALWKDVRRVRRTGLASMDAEASPEAQAIATAIRAPGGSAIAAIYVAIPRGRFSRRVEARCGQALRRAAGQIEKALAAAELEAGRTGRTRRGGRQM